MTFNEFQRRLNDAGLDERTKYLLSHMFEVQVEFSKQLDGAMNMMLKMAESMQNITDLHEHTVQGVRQILRGRIDGVEVYSVRNDPDEDKS
jgi:hypothetical protein